MREEFQLDPDCDLTIRWHAVHEKHRAEKDRIRELVKDYLARVPTENEYLRRKGAELLKQIGGADTGGDRQGTPTDGVAREQAGTDDFEWEPRSDCS